MHYRIQEKEPEQETEHCNMTGFEEDSATACSWGPCGGITWNVSMPLQKVFLEAIMLKA